METYTGSVKTIGASLTIMGVAVTVNVKMAVL